MSITRVGLIGNPVEHSRSPRMHNAAFAALGMNATYELWLTELENLPARIESLRSGDYAGCNITVPHKEAVMPLVDEVSATSQRIGAVNTIIPVGDKLVGDNTDAYGYAMAIRETYPDVVPDVALVLGAGGASRAVIVAMQEMGASDVIVVNRTYQRARDLASELGADALPWDDLADILPRVKLITNATALGWHGESVIDTDLVDLLPADALVTDLTYADTPFLQTAARRELRTLDGLGMLIHQGARSFELWFGVKPPIDVMTAAAIGN